VTTVVFLLEEPSARDLLQGLLPRLLPASVFVRYLDGSWHELSGTRVRIRTRRMKRHRFPDLPTRGGRMRRPRAPPCIRRPGQAPGPKSRTKAKIPRRFRTDMPRRLRKRHTRHRVPSSREGVPVRAPQRPSLCATLRVALPARFRDCQLPQRRSRRPFLRGLPASKFHAPRRTARSLLLHRKHTQLRGRSLFSKCLNHSMGGLARAADRPPRAFRAITVQSDCFRARVKRDHVHGPNRHGARRESGPSSDPGVLPRDPSALEGLVGATSDSGRERDRK
jgi:hypothetical protein